MQNVLMEVSLEHEVNTNGFVGWTEIPYTSELWSFRVNMHCPFLMSHSLIVESQEPESRQYENSGRKQRALTFEV